MITFTLTVTAQDEVQVIRLAQFHGYEGVDFGEAKVFVQNVGQQTMVDFVAEPFEYDLKQALIAQEKLGKLQIKGLAEQAVEVGEVIEE